MSAYCTKADLIHRLTEQELIDLTDRDGIGSIDDDVLDEMIEAASAYMDSFLDGRYDLPLDVVTKDLNDACIALTRARLYIYGSDNEDSRVKRDEDRAIRWLEGVRDGKNRLVGVDLKGDKLTTSGGVTVKTRDRIFTDDIMSKY